jgi:hypothetical protein
MMPKPYPFLQQKQVCGKELRYLYSLIRQTVLQANYRHKEVTDVRYRFPGAGKWKQTGEPRIGSGIDTKGVCRLYQMIDVLSAASGF